MPETLTSASNPAGESYILALAYEAFHPNLDVTSIDQINRVTEIHQPDGKNDLLQQVENGALTVVNGYLALGRLYRESSATTCASTYFWVMPPP